MMRQKAFCDTAVVNTLLTADSLRRLTISLIRAEMQDLVSRGLLSAEKLTILHRANHLDSLTDSLVIDEDGLGFDSLSRLSLILRFNTFFHLRETGVEDYLLVQRSLGDWCHLLDQHLSLVKDRAKFGFSTSGSAGPVKHVSHDAALLLDEVTSLRAGPLSQLSKDGRVISLVPPHHIYGFLFTCILPQALGKDVIDLSQLAPTAAFRHAQPGDVIIGTPLHWRLLRESGLPFASDVTGISSAGPADATTWAVRESNGLTSMTEVYGATETGGLGTRSEPNMPFRLLSHLRRDLDGTVVRLADQHTLPVQDRLDWVNEDSFSVAGRLDDVIKIGGVNVSPSHVASILRECDGVAHACVRMGKERLKAFLVPTPGTDSIQLEAELHAFVKRTLPAPARPASLTFGHALPVNAMGKSCDWDVETRHR